MSKRVIAVILLSALAAIAQKPAPRGSGGGGSVGTPYTTTGTASSVSITAATHGKGTKPIWTSNGSCRNTGTNAVLAFSAQTINSAGDVTATFTAGSTAYECNVYASGQTGTNGTNGTDGEVTSDVGTYADGQFVVSSGTSGDAIKPLTGTGVVVITDGVPSVVAGTSTNCVKVDGTSGACGTGGGGGASDFTDLSGTATDAQIPNNITIDLAAAATALAANGTNCSSGQAAGGVDASGASENCINLAATYLTISNASSSYQPLSGNLTAVAGLTLSDDTIMVSNGSTFELKSIPDCDNASSSKLLYDQTTNAFSCGTDQSGGGGGSAATPYPVTMSGSSQNVAYSTHLVQGPIAVTCKDGSGNFVLNPYTLTAASSNFDVAIGSMTGTCYIAALGSGVGSVTTFSVAALPSWLSSSVATDSTTPALTISAATGQTANRVLASPDSTTGAVSLRALVAADIPSLAASKITSGTMATARLGSGTADATTFLRGDGAWSTPPGAGDVVGPASATDNAIVRFDSTTGKLIKNSGVTIDASNNISTAGSLTIGTGASTAGYLELAQGTTASAGTTSIKIQAPTSVTSYIRTLPSAAGTGFYLGTNAAGVVTDTQVAASGTGSVCLTSGCTMVGPILGTPASGTLTNATGLPVSTGISGLGSGVATWLATASSANLAAAVTDELGTGALTLASVVQSQSISYCADANANDTYSCSLSPAPAALTTGGLYRFKANTSNTGAATINFNSLGAKTIVKYQGGAATTLSDNDIRSGQIVDLIYDGTNMQLNSILGNAPSGSGSVTSVAAGFTGGLISVSGSPVTTTGTLAFTVAGTSGGIPYFSSTSGWASSSALGSGAVVVGGGVGGAPATTNLTAAVVKMTSGVPSAATAGTDFTNSSSTETFTNKTIDCEGTGNACGTSQKIWLAAAGCAGTTGSLMWDTLATNAPTATCSAGSTETTMMRGTADFPDSDGAYSLQQAIMLPSDWTGNVDVTVKYRTTATSGNTVWQVATACRADGEVDDVAFNTANAFTADAAKGTTLQLNDATATNITTTGCAAGELMHIKLFRDRTHASDTITGVVSLVGAEVTTRRLQ